MILAGASGQSAYVATTTPLRIRLMISAPTAAVPGIELASAGYTGGASATTITFGTPAGTATGAIMLNTSAPSWTNGSGAAWLLWGLEIYDSAGTPARKAYGVWDNAPITVGPGSPFNVSASAIGWAIP